MLDPSGTQRYIPEDMVPQAQQAGGKLVGSGSLQTLDPKQEGMQPLSMVDRFKNAISSPANYAAAVKDNAQQIPRFASAVGEDIKGMVGSPGAAAQTIAGPAFNVGDIKRLYDMARGQDKPEPEFLDRVGSSLGINTQGVREKAAAGDLAGAVGHAALPLAATAAAGESKPGAELGQAATVKIDPLLESFNRAKRIDATKALDAALPSSAGVDTAKTFATPDVIQRIRETAARNGITEPTADNLKAAVDKVIEENRAEFHKYLDPVSQYPAQLPKMAKPVLDRLTSNIELTNPDVAARIRSGQTQIGDLDVIRQRINQDTKFPPAGSSETAMNSALKFAGNRIREKLYPLVERLNTLPEGSLADLKNEEGTFTELQPLTNKYAAQISKYASKEAAEGMLQKISGGARGTMGGAIGTSVGGMIGGVVAGPAGAAVGGPVGAVAGRFLAGREGKLAESSRLMNAVFGK